jgi:hypothetical protein
MTDYDLGRASGRIEITHDQRGYRRAEEAQESITHAADDTSRAFDRAEDSAEGYERQQRRTTSAVEQGTEAEERARKEREKATKAAEARKDAEREYKEVLDDTTASEEDLARALERRKKAVSDHLQQAKAAKKAERELAEEIDGVTQALSAIPDKKTTKLDVDTKDADKKIRSFNDRVNAARNAGKVLDKVSGPDRGIGKAGGIGTLGAAGGGAAGLLGSGLAGMSAESIIGIVEAVGQLSGLLGTLPGFIGVAASSMGTLQVATAGFGDSIDAILSGDSEAFAASLENISANAQDLMISVNALAPAIDIFKYAVQDAFTQDLAGWVQPTAEKYMPLLQTHMTNVADLMNQTIKDMLEWANQSSVIEDVQHIFENIETAVGTLGPTVRMVADAFLDVFSVSSDFLPQITGDIQVIAGEFRDWIQELRDNGGLAQWIQTGLDAFKQLVDIVKVFGSAFGRVFQIGQETGGGMLDFLLKIGTAFNNWINSAEGSNALSQFFTSVSQAADALLPVLKPIANMLFGTFLPMLADLGTAMAPGLQTFFEGLATAMTNLAPHIVALSGPMNELLTGLAISLVQVLGVIGPELPTFFQAITDTILALLPHLPAITEAIIMFVNDGMKMLPGIADDIGQILPPLIQFLGVMNSLKTGLIAAGTQIIVWLGKIAAGFLGFMNNLITVWPYQAGQAVGGFFSTLWEQITGGLSKVREMFGNFFSNLGEQISGGWNVLFETLTGIRDKIWNWLSELPQKAFDAGKALIEDLMRGIKDRLGSLGGIAKSIVETITDWLPGSPAKKGPLSGSGWSYKRGQSLSEDLAAGIASGEGGAGSAAGGVAETVSGALGMAQYGRNGESSLSGFVSDMLQLSGFAQKLISTFKDVSDKIFDAFRLFTTDFETGESTLKKPWQRTVSDDDLRKTREDKEFQNAHEEARKAESDRKKDPDGTRPGPAGRELATMGPVAKDATGDEIAKAIIGEGQRRNWSKEEIVAALSTARQESNLNKSPIGGGGAWHGVFQQDTSYPGRDDPNKNIEAFFDRMDAKRNSPGASGDPFKDIFWLQQRPGEKSADAAVNNGRGAYLDEISQWQDEMSSVFDRLAGSAGSATSSLNSVASSSVDIPKNIQDLISNPASVASKMGGGSTNYTPAAMKGVPTLFDPAEAVSGTPKGLPKWLTDLAGDFNLNAVTRPDGDTLHEAGFATDIFGDKADMDKMAGFLFNNLREQTLQLIYRGSDRDYGVAGGEDVSSGAYYAKNYAGHADHIHWATDVAPILARANAGAMPFATSGEAPGLGDPRQQAIQDNAAINAPPPDPRQQAVQDNAAINAQPDAVVPDVVPPPYVSQPGLPEGTMVRGDDGRLQLAETADNTSQSVSLDEQILAELRGQSSSLDQAITLGQDPNASDEQIAGVLSEIDNNIAALKDTDTPVARAQVSALETVQGDIAGQRGFTQGQDAISQAQQIAGGAASAAGDVFKVIDATLKAIGSAAEIGDTLVRGIENTEDVNKIIDEVQSFLELGSAVAGAVSSIAGVAAGIAGASGGTDGGAASGALSAVSSIAGLVQGVFDTINGVIDLGQEAYSIVSKYVGRFISSLLGNGEGSIMGDVKMLLDLNDNTLKSWSEDNPEDKRSRGIPKWMQDDYGPRNQTINRNPELNLYVGPGTDPNDAMNAAMWELKTGSQGVFSDADF